MTIHDDLSMSDQVCVVTGATSGLGEATAHALARMGAEVIVVGRNAVKCAATTEQIKLQSSNPNVTWLCADLSSQQDVRELARQIKSRWKSLHVLVNNAGVIVPRRRLSTDGIELTYATNYLSPFLLTNLLLDILISSAPSRVVNVCSVSHANADIDFENLTHDRGYRPFKAYARSKLALLLFTFELARRAAGTGVSVNAANPGLVRTKLAQNGIVGRLGQRLVHLRYRNQSVGPEEGAGTIIYLASSPEVEGVTGKYFTAEQETPPSPLAHDRDLAKELWEMSLDLTNLKTAQA